MLLVGQAAYDRLRPPRDRDDDDERIQKSTVKTAGILGGYRLWERARSAFMKYSSDGVFLGIEGFCEALGALTLRAFEEAERRDDERRSWYAAEARKLRVRKRERMEAIH